MSFTYRVPLGRPLTWAEYDTNLSEIELAWGQLSDSATLSLAAANFKGNWSSLTGALAVPASVYYNGAYWILLANVADVTAHTPGVSASWGGMAAGITANTSIPALSVTQTGSGPALLVEDAASTDSTPFVIDANGLLITGHTANISSYRVQIHSANPLDMVRWAGAASGGPTVRIAKSRSSTPGTYTIVGNGDDLGLLLFSGDDGVALIPAASILAEVDGTPGTNDMPGRLVFSTTADGAATPTERLRIDSAGVSTFAGPVLVPLGTVGAPSVGIAGDTNTGIYSPGADQLAVTTGGVLRMSVGATGDVLARSGAIGYGVGAGGTVTQATNKTTGVTLNKPFGQVTMNNAALAAGASVEFSVANTFVTVNDMVVATSESFANYLVQVQRVATGGFVLRVTNYSGGSLSEAVRINYAVIKGAVS